MEEQEYIERRLEHQLNWYDKKSQWNQKRYKLFRVLEIAISAMIPVLIPFVDRITVIKMLVALFGSAVTVMIGIQGIYNFHENWIEYRKIAETLKHEKFLYETRAGAYDGVENCFKVLVDRIESIISHENINWSQLNINAKRKSC